MIEQKGKRQVGAPNAPLTLGGITAGREIKSPLPGAREEDVRAHIKSEAHKRI